jgi:hypothetical protein
MNFRIGFPLSAIGDHTDFGYPVKALWLIAPKTKLFGFSFFRFSAYLMKVFPETRRSH